MHCYSVTACSQGVSNAFCCPTDRQQMEVTGSMLTCARLGAGLQGCEAAKRAVDGDVGCRRRGSFHEADARRFGHQQLRWGDHRCAKAAGRNAKDLVANCKALHAWALPDKVSGRKLGQRNLFQAGI